jgi:hypothetical protein
MAKQTLLEIVQDILSDSDGDEVNSINDTIEATQCAIVVRDVYSDIVDIHDLDSIRTLIELDATGASTPNVMTRPEGVHSIEFVKYDKKLDVADGSSYQYVDYLEPADFLDRVHGLDTTDSNVQEVTLSTGHPIPVRNDVQPTYYTVMDVGSDELVFDSFNSALETNLQQSKSLAYAMSKPTLTLADSSTIDLPKHLEVLVKRSARSMYFDLYKDGITAEVDRTRRRAEVRAQRQRHIVKNSDNNNAPDYGRK